MIMKKINTLYFSLFFCCLMFSSSLKLFAQDSITSISGQGIKYIEPAFWGTRVQDGHSIETTPKGNLELRIQHRLGRMNGGFNELFGLDQASIRLGLDYGILNWLMVGVGRSTMDKYYNGFIKAKILRQSTGKKKMPISLIGVADMGITSGKWANKDRKNYFSSRLYYTFQLIIGGNYWNRLGVQLAPTLLHRNLVATTRDHNDVFALGAAARIRISNVVALSGEYFYVFPHQIYSQINGSDVRNSFSFGVEIYTGNHTFQIFITNAVGSNEKQFLAENTENWLDKGIHLGFNFTRLFEVVR
jgi:hypothetical protein